MGDLLTLNVYNEKDEVIKSVEAHFVEIRFGTIKKLLGVLEVDSIDDTSELFKILYNSWSSVTSTLEKVFPDMTEEDWDGVKISELLPVIIAIMRGSFTHILSIPTDSKNSIAE